MKQELNYNQVENYCGFIIQSKQMAQERNVLACDMRSHAQVSRQRQAQAHAHHAQTSLLIESWASSQLFSLHIPRINFV